LLTVLLLGCGVVLAFGVRRSHSRCRPPPVAIFRIELLLLNARPAFDSSGSNRVIDEHAVILTKEHFQSESRGYVVEDVGKTESYDLHAIKAGLRRQGGSERHDLKRLRDRAVPITA
jgi:hypothetical protein